MHFRPLFDGVKAAPLAVVVLCLLTHAALKAVFFSAAFQLGVAQPVYLATRGLMTPVLLAGIIEWIVLILGMLLLVGNLRLRDLGLERRQALHAIVIVLALWVVLQGVTALMGGVLNGEVALRSDRIQMLPLDGLGRRLQALFGSGLIEEVLYRGFLLTQVYLLLQRRMEARRALLLATVLSSVYFGVNHIPAALQMAITPLDVIVYVGHVTLVGGLFAALFLRTGNLLVAAGAHALINDPVALFATPFDPALAALIGVAALLLSWPFLHRRFSAVFTLNALEGRPVI